MVEKSIILLFLITGLASMSCNRISVVDGANYIKYIDNPDNGLIQEYVDKEKSLKLVSQYKTPEYLAIKEIGPTNFDSDSVLNLSKEFTGGFHFSFNILSTESGYDVIKGKLSPKEYLSRITHMSGEIKNDFKLLIGSDTIPCSICHFERTYNISPDNILMLVFPFEKTTDEDLQLLYDDKLFGIGKVSLTFNNKNIKNTPKLL